VFPRALRLTLLGLAALFILVELIGWLILRTPFDPARILVLRNELPGSKPEVVIKFDRIQARRFGLTDGDKKPGTVRIFCLGGWGTLAMNQNDGDTWWGQLQARLAAKGLQAEIAARGTERTPLSDNLSASMALIESLRPDVLIINAGFDDAIAPPFDYRYDQAAVAAKFVPKPTSMRDRITAVSQIARLKRLMNARKEMGIAQNAIGRTGVFQKTLSDAQEGIRRLPAVEGLSRTPGKDPIEEYRDALTAAKALAARIGATLILTGEPVLETASPGITEEQSFVAYVSASSIDNRVDRPARTSPAWIEREVRRYADAAESFALAGNLPWVDLNNRIPHDSEHFVTDVMLTDKGAAVIADALLPVVEPAVRAKSGATQG
jgi:lysophospholipase L1-like esterase